MIFLGNEPRTMGVLELLLLVLLPLCGYYFWVRKNGLALNKNWNFPPGPAGLPIVGNLFSILRSSCPYVKFCDWADIYGGVYTVGIFTKQIVIVSCPKMMRQIFDHPASTGKFPLDPITLLSGGFFGITSTEGSTWMEQRRFCIRTLRQFGMGKRHTIQANILAETKQALEWISQQAEKTNGVIQDPIDMLKTFTSNTLWKIIRGDRYPLDDVRVKRITGEYWTAANYTMNHGLVFFPWLKWLAPKWSGYKELDRCCQSLRGFIREQFEEHQKDREEAAAATGDEGKEEPADMLDAYLDQLEQVRNVGDTSSSFYGETGWAHSEAVIAELFVGGGESTPHTLNWLILFLSQHSDVQKKLQDEIDAVIGTQEPSLMDKSRMPYTEAVILETLRKRPAFPLTTAHSLTEDVKFPSGIKLARGTLLVSNIYQAHTSKLFWGDPEAFRPERFLAKTGTDNDLEKASQRKSSVVVFNVGKRVCLGEPLAMDVLFLFVVKLFQAFEVFPHPSDTVADFESAETFMMVAKPFDILVKERKGFCSS